MELAATVMHVAGIGMGGWALGGLALSGFGSGSKDGWEREGG